MSTTAQHNTAGGLACGLATFVVWGLTPLYFQALRAVAPMEVLVHRMVWCALLMAVVIGARGAWPELVRCLRSRRLLLLLGSSSVMLAADALLYIYAVSSGRVLQSSLGYFVGPLFSVLLGTMFLREHLHWRQWAALSLSALGLGYLMVASGEPPWLALALAGNFALYGLARKQAAADSIVALSVETMLLLPAAAAFLGVTLLSGTASFAQGNLVLDMRLLFSGMVTAVPLLLFGSAVRGLRLSTLGVLQYVAPGLNFLLALVVFGESFQAVQAVGFGCIWAALLWFGLEGLVARRRGPAPEAPARVGLQSKRQLPEITRVSVQMQVVIQSRLEFRSLEIWRGRGLGDGASHYARRDSNKPAKTSEKRDSQEGTARHTAHFSAILPTGQDLDRLKQEIRGSNLTKGTKAIVLALLDRPETAPGDAQGVQRREGRH